MVTLALILSTTVAGILFWAGLEKIRDLTPLASTMHALGVPLRIVRPVAGLLALAEISVAAGLVFRPDSVFSQVGIIALASTFAWAGIVAWWRGEQIHCNCIGGMNRTLGLTQVVAFIPWLGTAAFVHLVIRDPLAFSAVAIQFCALGLVIAGVRSITILRARFEARGDRVCAMEMFLWRR